MKKSLSTSKILPWVILGVALLLRVIMLQVKPPHFDEGVNGWFTDQLVAKGFYNYDATNYHGPLHFYILMIFKLLGGRDLFALRLPSVLAGVASIWVVMRLGKYLGERACLVAAFFLAITPGNVFYSRYAIHETELLLFSLIAVLGYFRLKTDRDRKSLWMISMGIAGMIVTKETFVLHLGVFFISIFCLKGFEILSPSIDGAPRPKRKFKRHDVIWAALGGIAVVGIFYSGFFLNPKGIRALFESFGAWFATGQKGNGHEKPFFYWWDLTTRYEAVAVLGWIAGLRLLFPAPRELRWLAIYGLGVFLAYSIIPYKTPWCILNIIWPFYILAGDLCVRVVDRVAQYFKKPQFAALALPFVSVCLAVVPVQKTLALNFKHFDDDREPYVYVQTFSSLMEVTNLLIEKAKADPGFYHKPIHVFVESNWPLPWMLGDFTKVLYFGKTVGANVDAAVILVDAERKALLEAKLIEKYLVRRIRWRGSQQDCIVYFSYKTFLNEFSTQLPIFEPKKVEPLGPGEGLKAEYFQNAEWTGTVIKTEMLAPIEFHWEDGSRPMPAPFGIVFSGEILWPQDGPIEFALTSDDGSELEIDGQVVVSNLGAHPEKSLKQTVTKKAGWHQVRIKYNDYGGGMVLRLEWLLPGHYQEVVSRQFLRHSGGLK